MTGLLAISDHLAGAGQGGRQRQAPSGQKQPFNVGIVRTVRLEFS